MYSPEIEALLKKKGVEAGGRVRVTAGKAEYEGILMPRVVAGDAQSIVLKLENGYNLSVRYGKGFEMKKLAGGARIKHKAADVAPAKDASKPTVTVLGCGGTIASRVDYTTGAVFPAFSPGDMLASFPELKEVANIRGRKLFDLFSDDMTPAHWQAIAAEVAKEIKAKADGIILMHGTDTMHYTAAAMSFMLPNLPVPVVMVGSQRSSDRGSSDNAMNLTCGAVAAVSDVAEVGVCMHGTTNDDYCLLHQGTKVRKLHTSRRDAFRSINVRPFAKIWYEDRRMEVLRDDYKRRGHAGRFALDDKMNPRVGFVYNHPGMDPAYVASLANHFDGIVVAATGLGHVSTNPKGDPLARSIVPALKALVDSGMPVVFVPQTIYGRINLNVYEAGRILEAAGVIGNGCDWTPEAALVKLMWVLGHTKDPKKVRELMLTNVAGELTERTGTETFMT
ncbi:MAG: Glu-tRNA(Gln) amidotransferase subunit GatD [Candidatus Aenigmarchaeota archaeon]|nr:Glu-tRNA(Gln) amidotransferase subunit GatD [Candidatus Aenigmarchaeota archaeon]